MHTERSFLRPTRERDMPPHMSDLAQAREEAVKRVYIGTCSCMSGRGHTCSIHDAVVRLLLLARRAEQDRLCGLLTERANALRTSAGKAMEAGHFVVPALAVADELVAMAGKLGEANAP